GPASLTISGLRILVSGRTSTRTITAGATGASAAPRPVGDSAVMSLLLTLTCRWRLANGKDETPRIKVTAGRYGIVRYDPPAGRCHPAEVASWRLRKPIWAGSAITWTASTC